MAARKTAAVLTAVLLTVAVSDSSAAIDTDEDFGLNLVAPEEIGEENNNTARGMGGEDELNLGTPGEFNLFIPQDEDFGLNLVAPEEIGEENNNTARGMGGEDELNLGTPGESNLRDKFEGDIEESFLDLDGHTRKGVTSNWYLWKKNEDGVPIVRYYLNKPEDTEEIIMKAMEHLEEHTCLRFKKTGLLYFGARVIFVKRGGCYSSIGRQPFSTFFGQALSLGNGCESVRIVIHELGHAIGVYHEQSRSDRDDHVKIISGNIQSGRKDNFGKKKTRNYDTLYDYTSIMHYGTSSFSKNGDKTLSATDPLLHGLIVKNGPLLSFMDKLQLNTMYGCSEYWLKNNCTNVTTSPCQNLGYLGPDCACVCPEGTSGDNCQTKYSSYNDALRKKYLPDSEKLTAPATVMTDSYPTPQTNTSVFTKLFETPESCQKVVLTVVGFDMANRHSNDRCYYEGVDIRLGDPVTSGTWYCGSELKEGDTLSSTGQTLVLFYMRGKNSSNSKAGFKFNVTFNSTACTE